MISDSLITKNTNLYHSNPSAAALKNGDFVLCWDSLNPVVGKNSIYAQRYDINGVAIESLFRVDTTDGLMKVDPSVASLSNGGFVIAWESLNQDGDLLGIYAQQYDDNGIALGGEFRVNTYTDSIQENPTVIGLQEGGFIITWESLDQDSSGFGIYAQRYNSDGLKQGDEFRVNTTTESFQMNPVVISLNNGALVFAWSSLNETSEFDIYIQRYDSAGVIQGNESAVNANINGSQFNPSIATLTSGEFIVTWQSFDQNGNGYDIYAQRFDANGFKQGNEFLVNSLTIGNQIEPIITALNNDGFVISWVSDNEKDVDTDIYAQRFDGNGIAKGNEFLVNSDQLNNQSHIALVANDDGGFSVSWETLDNNGESLNIFGKRYSANGNEIGLNAIDRIFNWAEIEYSDLLSEPTNSKMIEGYYARTYPTGNAVGEINNEIYYYDGNSITFVGNVEDILPSAIAAGF